MNPSGYSGKPLIDKLGYQPGQTLQLYNAPLAFTQYIQAAGVIISDQHPTWLHAFFSSSEQIANFLQFVRINEVEKGLWVSWPKRSSAVSTDLSEQTFRDYLLPLGWVDTKVCSIDKTWSGLKFLRR